MPEKPRKKRRAAPVLPPPPRPRHRPLAVETTSVFPVRHDGPEKPRPVFARWTTPAWDPAIEVPIEDEDRVVPPLDELAADTAEDVPWWYEYQSSEGESEAA
jgi:hypothetical protein